MLPRKNTTKLTQTQLATMAAHKSPPPAPVVKDERLDIPIDKSGLDAAVAKAGSRWRLRAIVRAMLKLWVNDKFPSPTEDEVQRQMIRALPDTTKKKTP